MISIENKQLTIIIEEKISEIKNENLIDLFCTIHAFKILENKQGNEYEQACIQYKYIENMLIIEYINIFKLVRNPMFYDFIKYFKTFKKRMDIQNTETKATINEYLQQTEDISQKIIITMVFNIETNLKEIEKEKKTILSYIKIGEMDKEIFESIWKEK